MAAPLKNEELVKQYGSDSSTRTGDSKDQIAVQVGLLDVVIDDKYKPELVREEGRVKVVVEADANGIKIDHPFPHPKVIILDASQAKKDVATAEADPFYSSGTPTSFPPSNDHIAREQMGDKASVIFGRDDRIVFQDTSYPWRITGRIRTAVARGSGCMIGPRHVLTASHCVNWAADGSVGWIEFSPGYYNGPGPWGTFAATTVYSFMKNSGPLTDQQTAFDYVVLILDSRIGDTIGWAGTRNFSSSWVDSVSSWVSVGYPGDLTSTERPVYQGSVRITSKQDFSFGGRTGSVLGHFSDITGGMSGGPLWGTWSEDAGPRVVGVCSTRQGPPIPVPDGSTSQDNEFGGGSALLDLVNQARNGAP